MLKKAYIMGFMLGLFIVTTLEASYKKFIITDCDSTYPLPFTYHELTEQERKETIFVPEAYYAVVGLESAAKSILVGPCNPCFVIAVYCRESDKLLAFHKQVFEPSDHFLEIIKEEFSLKGGKANIEVFCFSRINQSSQLTPEEHWMQATELRMDIVDAFQLDENQISFILCDSYIPEISGKRGALATIFIDRNLKIFSTPLETVFRKGYPVLSEKEKNTLIDCDYKTLFDYYNKVYKKGAVSCLFAQILDDQTGLEKIEAICLQKDVSLSSSK